VVAPVNPLPSVTDMNPPVEEWNKDMVVVDTTTQFLPTGNVPVGQTVSQVPATNGAMGRVLLT